MSLEDWEALRNDDRIFFSDMIASLDNIDQATKDELQQEIKMVWNNSFSEKRKQEYLNPKYKGEYLGLYRLRMLHLLYNEVDLWSDQEILEALQASIQLYKNPKNITFRRKSFIPFFDAVSEELDREESDHEK